MEASTPPLATAKAEVTKPRVMEGPNHAWPHNERVISARDYSPASAEKLALIKEPVRRREVLVTPGSDGPVGLWMAMSRLRHKLSTSPFNCHQCFRTGATINGFPLLNGAGMESIECEHWQVLGPGETRFWKTPPHPVLNLLCVWWIMCLCDLTGEV